MQTRSTKGWKPLLIKYTALLMGICYLINPLQQQVFDIIHAISHTIVAPDNILSHDISYNENMRVHTSPNHLSGELDHEHKLIDLVQTIFETSNEDGHTQDVNIVKVKCDKHIVSNGIVLSDRAIILSVNRYPHVIEALKKGYLKKWGEPPQKYSC